MICPTCNNDHRKMTLGVLFAMHPELVKEAAANRQEIYTKYAVRSLRRDLDRESNDYDYVCLRCQQHHRIDSAIGRKHDVPQPVPSLALRQATAADIRKEAQELIDEADRIEEWPPSAKVDFG